MARVLVVDGSLMGRKRISSLLEAVGHEVIECTTAAEAMQEAGRYPRGGLELVISELELPDQDGLGLLRGLKAQPQMAPVPVIVVTAPTPQEKIVEVISAGAETMIARPFSSDVFLRRVTQALQEKAAALRGGERDLYWNVEEYLRKEIKRAGRVGLPVSLLVIHVEAALAPRKAVEELADALQQQVRESDAITVLTENEVVLILPDTDSFGAGVVQAKVQRLVATLDLPQLRGTRLSAGAASVPEDGRDPAALFRAARRRAAGAPV